MVLIALYFVRKNRPRKDDPRLSRGLQLLQSKIAVLEDLSDRVETQVKQLSAILEEKTRDVHQIIEDSESQLSAIDQSMRKSMDVAKIFQDKIPHAEIIERQTSAKYVRGAKMAHAGKTPEEISLELGLPLSECEMITKVNQVELLFDRESVPAWVDEHEEAAVEPAIASAVEPAPSIDFGTAASKITPSKAEEPKEKPAFVPYNFDRDNL